MEFYKKCTNFSEAQLASSCMTDDTNIIMALLSIHLKELLNNY